VLRLSGNEFVRTVGRATMRVAGRADGPRGITARRRRSSIVQQTDSIRTGIPNPDTSVFTFAKAFKRDFGHG